MREFLLRRLRRAPLIRPLWDEYERMSAARDTALAERDAAIAERAAALLSCDSLLDRQVQEQSTATPRMCQDYVLWAYRLLLGREPDQPPPVHPGITRQDLVRSLIASPEFRVKNVIDDMFPTTLHYMIELNDGLRFWLMSSDRHVSPSIATGNYEPAETDFIQRQVRSGMAAIDIGANLGWFTVHLAHLVGARGRVDAFEPRDDLFHLLATTVRENRLNNVTLHPCALGAENAPGQMNWSRYDINPGGTNLVSRYFTDPETTLQPTEVKTLDSYISHRIDFIKIDAEGSEPLIFRGCERILKEYRPTVLLEINASNLLRTAGCNPAEFGAYIDHLGYRVHGILPDGSHSDEVSLDPFAPGTVFNVAMLPKESEGG